MPTLQLSRQDILRVMQLHDQLGGAEFLRQYRQRGATRAVLKHEGTSYPARAILMVAHHLFKAQHPYASLKAPKGEADAAGQLDELAFQVVLAPSPRNVDWSRDELILALDVYFAADGISIAKGGVEVSELSRQLNGLAHVLKTFRMSTFRNAAGVYMKLMNFRRLDPNFVNAGRSGLSHGSKGDEAVWSDYADKRDSLKDAADAIRAIISFEDYRGPDGYPEVPDGEIVHDYSLDPDDAGQISIENRSVAVPLDVASDIEVQVDFEELYLDEAREGALLSRVHFVRERKKGLVEEKKRDILRAGGKLCCEACDMLFGEMYGSRGEGFIEVHHTRPLHTYRPNDKTKLSDLALLCSNCHRMVHHTRDWLTVEQLKGLIVSQRLAR